MILPDVNKYMKRKFIAFTACVTSFFLLVGFAFYVVFLCGNLFNFNVNWVKTFFLIYGLVAFICVAPMIIKVMFILSCDYSNECECECYHYENKE